MTQLEWRWLMGIGKELPAGGAAVEIPPDRVHAGGRPSDLVARPCGAACPDRGFSLIGPERSEGPTLSTPRTVSESAHAANTPALCELFDLPEPLRGRLRRGLDGRAADYAGGRTT